MRWSCSQDRMAGGIPSGYASHVAFGKTTSRKCLHSVHIGVANNVIGLSRHEVAWLLKHIHNASIYEQYGALVSPCAKSTDREYEVSQMRGDANSALRGFFIQRMSIGQQVLP